MTTDARHISRRGLLGAGAGIAAVAAISTTTDFTPAATAAENAGRMHGDRTIPFYGARQAGVDTPLTQRVAHLVYTLRPETDRDRIRNMLRILSDDAARLTRGMAPLADSEPELAVAPARLTVTIGVGAELVARTGSEVPKWLGPLPHFTIDALRPEWTGGDLLVTIQGDDLLTVEHAVRVLNRNTRFFCSPAYSYRGFLPAHDSHAPSTTPRNLFGQVDGTVNPTAGTADFDDVAWINDDSWLRNGTSYVLRRIDMNLDKWDTLDRPDRENSVGRALDTGAPLGGAHEFDEPDFEARGPLGMPVIHDMAHMRRARMSDRSQRIARRGHSFVDIIDGATVSGLLFGSFQRDVTAQFVPIQQSLAAADLLNIWTTPVGSAVFAIPPGCAEGGFVGETLFD
ncbi:MAG: hypothetical protein RL431_47 [Actinomycetota bacterium]